MLDSSMLLWLAIALGAVSASIALFGHYKDLPAFLTGPVTCQLESGGCAILFRTKRASLLGVPNALFGLIFYALLAIGLMLNCATWLLLLATLPALLMSTYLGYSLIKNHLQCRVCWAGHLANASIWLFLSAKLLLFHG